MTAPEFTDVQRAWLAEVHGVTLDVPVTLRPGMWVRSYGHGFPWYVTQFVRGELRLAVAWRDDLTDTPCWGTAAWCPVGGDDYIEVDPPESWVAAGRPGAIDDEPERWSDAVGRALYGDAWDTDDLADGISDLIPLIRSVEDWKAHALTNAENFRLREWKESALEQFGRWDDIMAEKIAAGRSGAIDERPSGVWKCTEHEIPWFDENESPVDPTIQRAHGGAQALCGMRSATGEFAVNCRWVELVYPASEDQ